VAEEPFRPVAAEEAHQNRLGVEVRQLTRRRVRVRRLCFCVVVRVKKAVLVVCPAVGGAAPSASAPGAGRMAVGALAENV
jgi:hypothetical protein